MATNYPTSLDTLTNPTSSDTLASVPHSTQHENANDAIEALQAKVGIDSSSVATSLDYKVANKPRTYSKVVAPTGITTEADYYCDGTADDVQIQAAIDAVATAGGGTVFLRAGNYNLASTITISTEHGIVLMGEGWKTVLTIPNSTDIYAITFSPPDSTTPIWAQIKDLKIDCNGANQTAGGGIYAAGSVECLFENIWFDEPYENGLYLYQISAGNIGHNNRVINCHFDNGQNSSGHGRGILMSANDENQIIGCDFQGMGGSDTEPYAIKDWSGLNAIIGNTFVSGKHGIKLQNATRTRIVGNTFDGGYHQVYASADECVIAENSFFLTGDGGTANTYSAIYIDFGGGNVITNNVFETHTTNNQTRSFIRDNGDGANMLANNAFKINGTIGTARIEDSGTAANHYDVRSHTAVVAPSGSIYQADYFCDGTDDDVQIQAAIDAVEAAGGGTVFLRAGTYVIGTQLDVEVADVHIVGEGVGSTILQAEAAYSGFTIIDLGASHNSIRSLTVDGNKANQTTGNHAGITLNVDYNASVVNQKVVNCEVKNINRGSSYGHGIYIAKGTYASISNCYVHDNEFFGIYNESADYTRIENCVSVSNGSYGVLLTGNYAVVSDCVAISNSHAGFQIDASHHNFNNCVAISNGEEGFNIVESATEVDNCRAIGNGKEGVNVLGAYNRVSNCYISDNTWDGIFLTGKENILSNNVLVDNAQNGIQVDFGRQCVISGNSINANDGGDTLDADNTYSGILLTATSTRNVVSGNIVKKGSGTDDYQYGIREASTSDDYNIITNNIVTGAQTAQISSQGANTDVSHNITS